MKKGYGQKGVSSTSKASSPPSSPEKSSPSKYSPTKQPHIVVDIVQTLYETHGKESEARKILRKNLEKFHLTLSKKSGDVIPSARFLPAKKEAVKAFCISLVEILSKGLQHGIIVVEDLNHHHYTLYDDEPVKQACVKALAQVPKCESGIPTDSWGDYHLIVTDLKELIKQKDTFVNLKSEYKTPTLILSAQRDRLKMQVDHLLKGVKSSGESTDSDFDCQFDVEHSSDEYSSHSPQRKFSNSVESEESKQLRLENRELSKRIDDTAFMLAVDVSTRSDGEIKVQKRIAELEERHKSSVAKHCQLTRQLSAKDQEIKALRQTIDGLLQKVESLEAKLSAGKSKQSYDEEIAKINARNKKQLDKQSKSFEQQLAEQDKAAKEREAMLRAEIEQLKRRKVDESPKEVQSLKKENEELRKQNQAAHKKIEGLEAEQQYLATLSNSEVKAEYLKKAEEFEKSQEECRLLRLEISALKWGDSAATTFLKASAPVPSARKKLEFVPGPGEGEVLSARRPMFVELLHKDNQRQQKEFVDDCGLVVN